MELFKSKKRRKKSEEIVEHESFTDLNVEKKDMIRGVVELSDRTVKEIMVPRIDVVFLKHEMSEEDLLKTLIDSGHSRFPVYSDTIDNVDGILYVKDLLEFVIKKEPFSIKKTLREAYYVPETMKLDALLKELKNRKVHIAIAVDEYGGVSGIVCLEDIIEEIVGDIQDEFDNEDDYLVDIEDRVWLCDARINIEELNEKLSIELPDENAETLGGYLFDLFGKIPGRYEKIEDNGITFIVQSVEGHKINKVKIALGGDNDGSSET